MSKPKAKSRPVVGAQARPAESGGPTVYLFAAVALLSLIGLADAIYLTVEKLSGRIVQCNGISDCEQVLSSQYATIAGIPLAAFGALAYFTVFSLATLAAFKNERARTLLFFLVGLMLAISILLFALQAFVIHAYCLFCLLSAAITLLLFALVAFDRFYLKQRSAGA